MNIIEKEKARQFQILDGLERHKHDTVYYNIFIERGLQHKQSLINLKEYMEEEDRFLSNVIVTSQILAKRYGIEEDIQELTKLIEAYE